MQIKSLDEQPPWLIFGISCAVAFFVPFILLYYLLPIVLNYYPLFLVSDFATLVVVMQAGFSVARRMNWDALTFFFFFALHALLATGISFQVWRFFRHAGTNVQKGLLSFFIFTGLVSALGVIISGVKYFSNKYASNTTPYLIEFWIFMLLTFAIFFAAAKVVRNIGESKDYKIKNFRKVEKEFEKVGKHSLNKGTKN